ncbi:MAG: ABC transporter substrate-binding protein [Deltaproteobacteria bacterium]|nr:ABC transporter substrate-binding protein [Deltaproteobacteria bacterium]
MDCLLSKQNFFSSTKLLFFKLCLGCFLFFIFVFQACSQKPPEADLTLAFENDPSSLDPRYPGDAYSAKVQDLMYQGLLKWGENLQLEPDLAESYEFLTPTRLKIVLKPDIFFHDGTPLRAQDVIATFQSIQAPDSTSPHRANFSKLVNLQALDNRTILLDLSEITAPFLSALTVGIIPKHFIEDSKKSSEIPPGTGPFCLLKRSQDAWLYLEAFQKYSGTLPKVKSIKIQVLKDATTRVLKLIKGEVDLVQNALSWPMLSWIQEHTSLHLESSPGINYRYLAFNLQDPILKDRRVRRAMAMALDRRDLIKHYLAGYAREATGVLAPSHAFYEGEVLSTTYNPDLAKQLLEEAGYPDPDGEGPLKRFKISYKTSNQRESLRLARAIARSFEAIGIEVDLKAYEWGTFYRDIRQGSFQIFTSTWVGIKDPDIYYYLFHSSQTPPQGGNRGYYKNPQVDRWLEEARLAMDWETRAHLYSEVQKQIALDIPYISLWWEDNVVVTSPKVKGYHLSPDASLKGLLSVEVSD